MQSSFTLCHLSFTQKMIQLIALSHLWRTLKEFLARISEPKVLFIWLLSGATLATFIGNEPEIKIGLKSTGGQIRLIEPSPSISRHGSGEQKVLAGHRSVTISVPKTLNRKINLEFSSFESAPEISSIEVRSLGISRKLRIDATETLLRENKAYQRIEIRLPFLFTLTSVATWLIIASLVLPMFMLWPRRIEGHQQGAVLATAWLVVCFSIFTYQVVWSSVQLPWMDDWRYYSDGPFSLITRQFDWVLVSGNDTYFFTGQAIDWILLGLFDGDFLSVRLVGLIALAGFLSFATSLILHHCRRYSAIAIILLSLSISSSGYWGHAGIAYHQMLPVLFFVWSMWQLTKISADQKPSLIQALVLASLALGAGLAYISGPLLFIATSVAAVTMFALQRLASSQSTLRTGKNDGWGLPVGLLGVIGVSTMLLQLSIVVSRQGSLLQQSHASATVLPIEPRFWWFIGGLFGRAAGVQAPFIVVDILVIVFFLSGLAYLIYFAFKKSPDLRQRQMLLIALSIGIGLFMYAGMVAAGRAGLAGTDPLSWASVSAYAKTRFHYWWIAALLPIYVAILLELIQPGLNWKRFIATPLLMVLIAFKLNSIIFDDASSFAMAKQREHRGVDCLRTKWMESRLDRNVRFLCPDFYPEPIDHFIRPMLARDLRPGREIYQYEPRRKK